MRKKIKRYFYGCALILLSLETHASGGEASSKERTVLSAQFKYTDSFELKDEEKAELIREADSNPDAAFRLYQYFMVTVGDYPNGILYLRKAATHGHVVAMYNLGYMLSDGKNSDDNIDEALLYYSKSFEAGHFASATRIGEIYAQDGKYKDIDKAVSWFKKAAEAGHKPAEIKLKKLMQENPDSSNPASSKGEEDDGCSGSSGS